MRRNGRTTRATGALVRCSVLAEIPRHGLATIALVPFCQLRERGFEAHSEGEQILALVVDQVADLDPDSREARDESPIRFSRPVYTPDDGVYSQIVRDVVRQEIQAGEGSNFVISREARTKITNFGPQIAEQIFWRLVRLEPNAYLTFSFCDGTTHWIGASPERNVTIRGRTIVMNPICGTLPKTPDLSEADLLAFVTDPKEIHELFQVVDEELKMMARLCPTGGRVVGPCLKEMGAVIHTEYVLEGETDVPPLDAFRESMFAPTMVGSPLQNAARVITRHEPGSRRYYSSAILILEGQGAETSLDSAITIRTMELRSDGTGLVRAGASIVRDSDPEAEVQEVAAKASTLLGALGPPGRARVTGPPASQQVLDALRSRNSKLSEFWMTAQPDLLKPPSGLRAVLVDHEDDFSFMLAHLLRHAGIETEVRSFEDAVSRGDADVFVLGPGPGNPLATEVAKIRILHERIRTFVTEEVPFIAVCLSHQVLCHALGLDLVRLDPPLQGVQKTVDLFGAREHVGFYNTFIPVARDAPPSGVEMSILGEHVIALRSRRFVSFQFHVESVLTTRGMQILENGVAFLRPSLDAEVASR